MFTNLFECLEKIKEKVYRDKVGLSSLSIYGEEPFIDPGGNFKNVQYF